MNKTEFRAMGCAMMAVIDSEAPDASQALAEVPGWFGEWERVLSRFREDSELCHLNRLAGRPVRVSQVLWDVLQDSLRAARRSQGLVVPCLLAALESIGYRASFETILAGVEPSSQVLLESGAAVWEEIELNSRAMTVHLPDDMRLDFGGIAKGWAADRALKRLALYGPALVDAGGDIAAGRPPYGEPGWPVAIGDPLDPAGQLGLLCLAQVCVATSGRDYRKWQQGGEARHHILDPRTGLPAQTDVLSATVIAPTTRTAEMGAKTALILGSGPGLAWMEAQDDLAALLVRDDGKMFQTRNFKRFLWGSQ